MTEKQIAEIERKMNHLLRRSRPRLLETEAATILLGAAQALSREVNGDRETARLLHLAAISLGMRLGVEVELTELISRHVAAGASPEDVGRKLFIAGYGAYMLAGGQQRAVEALEGAAERLRAAIGTAAPPLRH